MDQFPVPFESLYYYKTDEGYTVNCPQFKDYYVKKKIYNEHPIRGKSSNNKDIYQICTTDPKMLAKIFSIIYDTEITEEQVLEHTRSASSPSQIPAGKAASAPTPAPESKPKPLPTSNQMSPITVSPVTNAKPAPQSSANNVIPAVKTNSTPVTKPSNDIVADQPKNALTFDSLFYFLRDDGCYVKSELFKERYKKKSLFSTYQITVTTDSHNKGFNKIATREKDKLAKIFSDVLETSITPDQIIQNAKKDPKTLPPPIPAEKTSSSPTNMSVSSSIVPDSKLIQSQASKTSSTPISQMKTASPAPSATETSSTDVIPELSPNTVVLSQNQYEKLLSLLGAASWMTKKKVAKLVFNPNK